MPVSATVVHFDATFGISGDMVLGALISAGVPAPVLAGALRALHPKLGISASVVRRGSISGTGVRLRLPEALRPPARHAPGHAHPAGHGRTLGEMTRTIARTRLPEPVKRTAQAIFRTLGAAEARVHRTTPDKVHFHEVGAWDALADVVGAAAGFHHLGVSRASAGAILLGSGGTLRCAHGVLPLPAPAVLECLRGFPVPFVDHPAETVTPTGAAILATLARPGPSAPLAVASVGYGAGARDDGETANFFRLVVGTVPEAVSDDWLWEVQTNLDDCSPQVFDYLGGRLFAAGARDVVLVPIQMKKGRPAVRLEVLADEAALPAVEALILTETPALGLRRHRVERRILPREIRTVRTAYGTLRVKRALDPRGIWKAMPEYEDCRRAAERAGMPLREVMAAALKAASNGGLRES